MSNTDRYLIKFISKYGQALSIYCSGLPVEKKLIIEARILKKAVKKHEHLSAEPMAHLPINRGCRLHPCIHFIKEGGEI